MSATAQLQSLIARHCETIAGEVETAARSVAALLAGGAPDALRTAIEAAHKIVGSSGSIGFPEVSAAARELEVALKTLDPQTVSPGRADATRIATLLSQLATVAKAMAPERSSLAGLKL